jgi:H+/gluconate symporter-like permease
MQMKVRKVLPCMLAVIFILLAIQWVMGMLERPDMHAMAHSPQPINPGYGHGHFIRGHHPMSGFHFLGSAISLVFWLATIAIVIGWLREKRSTHHFNHTITEVPVSYYSYTANPHQLDFLDEWEKKQINQTNHKEEQ